MAKLRWEKRENEETIFFGAATNWQRRIAMETKGEGEGGVDDGGAGWRK